MTPSIEQEQTQVAELAQPVQEATGDTAQAATQHGIELIVVKLPEAK